MTPVLRIAVCVAGLAVPLMPVRAQTDSSSWTSGKVVTPAERVGGARLLKSAPLPGAAGLPSGTSVITTRTPPPAAAVGPRLPSSPEPGPATGDSSIAKSGAGGDPAYEAFDLGQ